MAEEKHKAQRSQLRGSESTGLADLVDRGINREPHKTNLDRG